METISTSTELKNAIQVLEFEQALKKELLKVQVYQIYENLKPVNLIKNTLAEVATSPYLTDNILGATVGVASGYLTKKIAVGRSGNVFRKLLGTILQFGVTNIVAKQSVPIKLVGQFIYQRLRRKKEAKSINS